MTTDFRGVQRIVLQGGQWGYARHFVFDFGGPHASPPHLLYALRDQWRWPSWAHDDMAPSVQVSLGFTRRGLERAGVPAHVMSCFALKAPAFHAGAAQRAGRHLGAVGVEAPGTWAPGFAFATLDAVIHLHAEDTTRLAKAAHEIQVAAARAKVHLHELQFAERLPPHPDYAEDPLPGKGAIWVHFGYRDGLARVGIKGWSDEQALAACKDVSKHQAGEFVLGHVQNSGGNPWIAGPGQRVWPRRLRNFFRNGSFGVLHQIQQDVKAFEDFVTQAGRKHGIAPDELKAKLCGRYPDGRPLGQPKAEPDADFDFENDRQGVLCPFGAHVRRMNPRESDRSVDGGRNLAHFSRARPLLRRGMPYGPAAWAGIADGSPERGLMAQFFCASIEDQYEHLVGQWGDRVPLGSPDHGGARDPFSGSHDGGDGPFEIPQQSNRPSLMLKGLIPFTRTRGVAYLFYPSKTTLIGIAGSELWLERDEGVE